MLTIHQFNAEAFARVAQYVSRASVLRRGTEWRMAAMEHAVARSQVLIANADALLTINATRLGWLWPDYCTGSPAEEHSECYQSSRSHGLSAPTKFRQQAGRGELMNCESARNTGHGSALVGMARDLSQADRNTERTGIGAGLRTLHSVLLREEIPDRMVELIEQLDQQTEASPRGQDADAP
jgi:hypothetical protein